MPVFWGEEGGGGGVTKRRFVWRGCAPTSNTIPFIYYRKPNFISKIKLSQQKKILLVYKFMALEIFLTSSFNMAGHYFS